MQESRTSPAGTADKQRLIRKYATDDRADIRRICCDTGLLGTPIDQVFEDREIFADVLTSYFTDCEPQSSFVLEQDGMIAGYLLGTRYTRQQRKYERQLVPGLLWRVLRRLGGYSPASRRYLLWVLFNSWREVPEAPGDYPHFHINLLAEARSVASTRLLVDAFLAYLHECGEQQVYGQVVSVGNRRAGRTFERYGFKILNKSEITKYRKVCQAPVFLTTILKDLQENSKLYS